MARTNKREQDGIDISNYNFLPTPESDSDPQLTKFVLDIGEFYQNSSRSDWRANTRLKNRAINKIAHYLSDAFIQVLKRELKIE